MDTIVQQQSSASWSETIPQKWIQESRSVCERGLVVTHIFQPASEVSLPNGVTEHLLVFSLDNNNQRQITRIDGREYEGSVTKDSILLIPARASTFCYWECDRPEAAVSFQIDPKRLQQVAAENDCLHPDRIELRPILQTYDAQIQAFSTSFLAEMYNGELGGKLYTESLANLFLIHLLRKYCTQKPILRSYDDGLSRYQLQYTLDLIHDHLSDEFKLQDIAEQLGMSQYYFCRLFKQSMGVAPYQYVLQQRVELAKQLLKQPEKSIADIALECGFSTQSQMTQHFRKLTGTTPKAYRRT